ncbi:hypothetical protein ACFPC0_13710 [Streptomyces andamanensis]|uniref:Uncharacterized protein n=1 Tax=Streptomyces andamanensis TaxID=1565035 RepID=A0ABV8TDY1_9ACTN
MTPTDSLGVFARIDRDFLEAPDALQPFLTVTVGARTVRLSPRESRRALYGPAPDTALRTAVWRQAVSVAQREPMGRDSTWRLLVVWLALPGLYRSLHKVRRRFGGDRTDLEAEAVLGVLTALDAADPSSPDAGGQVIKAGVNRMWDYVNRTRKEVPVVDITAFADARDAVIAAYEPLQPPGGWELHLTPPPLHDGLAATLRFAESRTQREGERLGALAQRTGLSHLVFRARRHEEADLIGTLSLLPAGGRR